MSGGPVRLLARRADHRPAPTFILSDGILHSLHSLRMTANSNDHTLSRHRIGINFLRKEFSKGVLRDLRNTSLKGGVTEIPSINHPD